MKFVPFLDRVLVKRLSGDEASKKGIVLPTGKSHDAKYDATRGEVLAMGPGAYNSFSGKFVDIGGHPYNIKIGDIIVYPKAAAVEIIIQGESLYTVSIVDIYGKLVDEGNDSKQA